MNSYEVNSTGFTLVELLVVIAIVGLLAAIVVVRLTTTKAKSRDAQRIADIKNLKTGLEFYNNQEGHYVESGNCEANSWITINGSTDAVSSGLIGLNLFPVGKAPRDPMAPGQNYEYCYSATTKKYQVRYTLETNSTAGSQGTHITGP